MSWQKITSTFSFKLTDISVDLKMENFVDLQLASVLPKITIWKNTSEKPLQKIPSY